MKNDESTLMTSFYLFLTFFCPQNHLLRVGWTVTLENPRIGLEVLFFGFSCGSNFNLIDIDDRNHLMKPVFQPFEIHINPFFEPLMHKGSWSGLHQSFRWTRSFLLNDLLRENPEMTQACFCHFLNYFYGEDLLK